MFECHRFECHRCLETSRIMSYVDSTCSLARWCLYLCHLSHLFPPCVHSCPLLSMCVLIPHTHFYNNLSSFEFRTGKMFFPTQVQIIPLLAFLCSPSILWKFRLSSDHYQQLHLPRKPRTDLTGFRRLVLAGHKGRWTRVCISWSQGKVDKGSRGREETRLPSTTLLAATAGVC